MLLLRCLLLFALSRAFGTNVGDFWGREANIGKPAIAYHYEFENDETTSTLDEERNEDDETDDENLRSFLDCDFNEMNVGEVEYPNDPITVNECIEKERTTVCEDIEVSECPDKECLLGYEIDFKGCVLNCQCAVEGLFEGDIMVKNGRLEDLRTLYDPSASLHARAASKRRPRWNNIPMEDGNYRVPYVMDPEIRKSQRAVNAIRAAMSQFSGNTCLRFQPRIDEVDYIKFVAKQGCYSDIGRDGGAQEVSIGKGCRKAGLVMHELMHVVGFFHEQSRPDRDRYVRVLWGNISPGGYRNFRKMNENMIDSMGSPYDYDSIMHYDSRSFSRNGMPTILRVDNGKRITQQRARFSQEDIIQINMMYNC